MEYGEALGRELGLDDETIAAVADWQSTDRLTDTERVAVELADVLSRTPAEVSDDLRQRLAAAFTPKQTTELCNEVSWENARARFNRGVGVSSGDGYR